MNAAAAMQTPAERLRAVRAAVPGRLVFTTSLGLEDQFVTFLIHEQGLDVDLVTLDTGRLFPETYMLWGETEARYGLRIHAMAPDAPALEALVERNGIDGFYASLANRHACCGVRKVEPLNRALAGAAGWVTGLRAQQSAERAAVAFIEADATRGLVKINPLYDWNRDQLLAAIAAYDVPVNRLHAQGFASIGCAPCTRAIKPGEPERAGRWWWEDADHRECGLHIDDDGRVTRAPSPRAEAFS